MIVDVFLMRVRKLKMRIEEDDREAWDIYFLRLGGATRSPHLVIWRMLIRNITLRKNYFSA